MLVIPTMMLITSKIAKRTRKYFLNQQESLGKLNGIIEECISGQKLVKVFTREENKSKNLIIQMMI